MIERVARSVARETEWQKGAGRSRSSRQRKGSGGRGRMGQRGRREILLAIDPSIRACGLAVFRHGRLVYHTLVRPQNREEEDEYVRAGDVFQQVQGYWQRYRCTRLILEVPAHWAVEGFAARESGNLQKLIFLCGMLATLQPCVVVWPSEWKGQMPKAVMRNRLWDQYQGVCGIDMAKINHNTLDAIGIGTFYLRGSV